MLNKVDSFPEFYIGVLKNIKDASGLAWKEIIEEPWIVGLCPLCGGQEPRIELDGVLIDQVVDPNISKEKTTLYCIHCRYCGWRAQIDGSRVEVLMHEVAYFLKQNREMLEALFFIRKFEKKEEGPEIGQISFRGAAMNSRGTK